MLSHSAWPHRLSPSMTQILPTGTNLAHAQSEESGIEPGHIATITGSLDSFPADPDHYDTDHTDLGSEGDEAELRRNLLRDQWRLFFDKYDPEGFGEIPWSDLLTAMSDGDFQSRVNAGKRQILLEKARTASTPAITFQDFVNVGGMIVLILKLHTVLDAAATVVVSATELQKSLYFMKSVTSCTELDRYIDSYLKNLPKFSAAGFFCISKNTILSILSTAFTFLLVIVQFDNL